MRSKNKDGSVNSRFRKHHPVWVHVVGAVLLVGLMVVFAAGCGSATTTTTSAPASSITSASTATTSASTATTAASTDTTGGSTTATSGTVTVKGAVDNPVTLTVADLQKMNVVEISAVHPKLGKQTYKGVRFSDLLALFKVQSSATTVDIGATDGYMAEIALADLQKTPDALLAIGDDGKLNTVMPGMQGKAWVKGAITIELK